MKPLTPEQLAPYLPHDLQIEVFDYKSDYVGRQYDKVVGIHQWDTAGKFWSVLTDGGAKPSIDRIKPILYPPSQLTKPTMIEGEMKIPILELAKISFPEFEDYIDYQEYPADEGGSSGHYVARDIGPNSAEYFNFSEGNFYISDTDCNTKVVPNQYALFQWLFKNHFAIGLEPDQYIDKAVFELNYKQ